MILAITINPMAGAVIAFLGTLVGVLVINMFFLNLGTKIALLEAKKARNLKLITYSISIASVIIDWLFNVILHIDYFENIITNTVICITVTLILSGVVRWSFFSKIEYEKLQQINEIEKGIVVLEANNLKIYYQLLFGALKRSIGAVKAVDGITFNIKAGETIGLVGESGCGKSTIAKGILGLVDITEGEISFHKEPIPPKYSAYLRQKIQIVYQDPDASLNPRKKIVDIVGEPLRCLMGITKKQEIRERVLSLLERVSLKREHMDRFPHEFSGGQKQRITIARALACNPEVIILDEPTSALDVSVQAQILNLLKDLQTDFGYAFLFITHDLAVVNHIADRVYVMYLGKFVETAPTDVLFSNPSHPYSKALLASRSTIDPKDQEIRFVIKGEVPSPIFPPPGCGFSPRCDDLNKSGICSQDFPKKIEIEKDHFVWCSGFDNK